MIGGVLPPSLWSLINWVYPNLASNTPSRSVMSGMSWDTGIILNTLLTNAHDRKPCAILASNTPSRSVMSGISWDTSIILNTLVTNAHDRNRVRLIPRTQYCWHW